MNESVSEGGDGGDVAMVVRVGRLDRAVKGRLWVGSEVMRGKRKKKNRPKRWRGGG